MDKMDKTRNLYSSGSKSGIGSSSGPRSGIGSRSGMGSGPGSGIGSGSRITVEVLDDTEQDATPRDNVEIEKEKKITQQKLLDLIQLKEMQNSELNYRNTKFESEQKHLKLERDTFVPAPTVTIHDVTREYKRLNLLEESARKIKINFVSEADQRRAFLQNGKIFIQILFSFFYRKLNKFAGRMLW